eukprot:6200203-Pleurochrysis_carterae.AAC.1
MALAKQFLDSWVRCSMSCKFNQSDVHLWWLCGSDIGKTENPYGSRRATWVYFVAWLYVNKVPRKRYTGS